MRPFSSSPLISHIKNLPPSDKAVALLLASVVVILSVAGLYALERMFLVEVPSYGGSLHEGVVGHPRFANPLLALSDADRDLVMLTYAGLMGYAADGTLVPVLAEGYEVSEDGTTYTFRLRKNAKFADGTGVSADDVVFTVEKAQDPSLRSPELANWASIRAEALDARTVRFTLPSPYAPFLADATLGILPARLWRGVKNEEFPFSPLVQEPVGAGPFTVADVVRDGNGTITRYDLVANEDYALGRPYLDRMRFTFFDDAEALYEALRVGRVESGYGLAAQAASEGVLIEVPYARVFGVFWNQVKEPVFARLEVRKALSVALDRGALVQEALGGYGSEAYGPVPPGSLSAPVHEGVVLDRIEEAASLLEDGGWAYDADARVWKHDAAGELSVTLSTGNVPELKAVAEHLRRDWEKLGVPVEIEVHEPSALASDVIRPRAFGALLFGMSVGREHDLFAFWDSSEREAPGLNVAQYANRAADALLEDIREEPDREKRSALLAELDATIAEDYPAAFTHAPDFLYRIPKDLRGFALSEVALPSDRLSGAASWYKRTEWVWPAFVKGVRSE